MHIAKARAQRVVLVDREAQRNICTIALVGIVRQIRIVSIEVVIEDTTAEADAIHGKVRVRHRQFSIGLVIVFGAVNSHRIAGTEPVILLNAGLEAYAAFRTVTHAKVKATGIAFFNFIDHVNLIRAARHALRIGINRFKVAQTIQTIFPLVDQVAAQPGTFHLTHFATQNGIFRGIVAFEANFTHVVAVTRIDVYVQLHGLITIVDFRLGLNARIGVTVATEEFLNVILHFGHFGAVIQLARLDFCQRFDFCRMPCQVSRHLHARKLVLIAFGNIDGDVDPFFIRRQANLSGVNVETSIAAIQIVAAQRFEISRQLLFLIFAIADHVPPRHFIAQLEGRNQFIGAECMIADDIDLLDFR